MDSHQELREDGERIEERDTDAPLVTVTKLKMRKIVVAFEKVKVDATNSFESPLVLDD